MIYVAVCHADLVRGSFFTFFRIPYSKTLSDFQKAVDNRIETADKQHGVFTENDIVDLPVPVQRFFRTCGYLGTPKMSYMKASFKDVDFVLSEKKTIRIDYVQYNFVSRPERLAYIDSSLFGIPFEGLDAYEDGKGSMKGMFGKVIPLFNQQGASLDQASLVTVLAECFITPAVVLQDYITWRSIDDTHAEATISYGGVTAGGIFTFQENGAVISFRTADRIAVDMQGSERQAEWSALYSNYRDNNGVWQPMVLTSIWHYQAGDCIYFNENETEVVIEYGY